MDLSNGPGFLPLTRLEVKCLTHVSEGWHDTAIGKELTLTDREVAAVIDVAIKKLGVSNRMAAIAKATRLGLIGIGK
jgi:Response regulator containing a CheY-like receiver domain and an HTH DNA-binding domain